MSATEKHMLALGAPLHGFTLGSVDARMIAVVRCLLALPVFAILHLDATESPRFLVGATALLAAYLVWAVVALVLATRRTEVPPPRYEHWVDMGFAASMVMLTQGSSSVYFFVFLFAILIASFSRGFAEGLAVTFTSVLLLALTAGWLASSDGLVAFDLTIVRPFYLLTLGSMMAYWGGHEITHRRRLRLLQEINNQWNPRFGHDHAIGTNLQRALDFFSASACVLVLRRPTTPPIHLTYHTTSQRRGQAILPSAINQETAAILLSFPRSFSARYEQAASGWRRWFFGGGMAPRDSEMAEQCRVLANLLDASNFLTVPYSQRDGTEGRVFLTAGKRRFSQGDVDFFGQLMRTISNVVEGMQLMDELVSRAAEHERYRISLDIHDTTVQPYIGLKLGLDALAREAGPGNPLSRRIGELLGMTDSTIRDLRRYMTALQEDTALAGDSLLSAVRDQASHYHRFYGIEVEVRCDSEVPVNSQLAGALLQIVAEGLSNILRHTTAKRAWIAMRSEGQRLLVEIGNEPPAGAVVPVPQFKPRSIDARTRSLGGSSLVEQDAMGYTIVRIVIPL